MLKQQYDSKSERQCWNSARERNRLKARFNVQQRVRSKSEEIDWNLKAFHATISEIRNLIYRVVRNDRSYFSLPFISEHVELLSLPFNTQWLRDDEDKLYLELNILSRFGQSVVDDLLQKVNSFSECTVMEYASWIGRYGIVGNLILGGICPSYHGLMSSGQRDIDLVECGRQYLAFALEFMVPLSLSNYVVKKVVDMRFAARRNRSRQDCDEYKRCPICLQPDFSRLLFPCMHSICEVCFWQDIIHVIGSYPSCDNVVQCMKCRIETPISPLPLNDPICRREESCQKFLALPEDSAALKRRTKAKKKINPDELCTAWKTAVRDRLGSCQAVRADKFFMFVEKGLYPYVLAICEHGIDVQLVNEYGQTALFLAVWYGHADVVEILLQYGASPMTAQYGGLTPLHIAEKQEIINLLENTFPVSDCQSRREFPDRPLSSHHHAKLTYLIDHSESKHPGAGAFVIDNCVSSDMVNWLLNLRECLPTATSDKKAEKSMECAVRRYFCDALRWIVDPLEVLLRDLYTIEIVVKVFPHMRFLSYETIGAKLAPHVDLCRQHPFEDNIRSSHTFILYLTSCSEGGGTNLLPPCNHEIGEVLVQPRVARILVFPHRCLHAGHPVIDLPKILLRGELFLSI